jgi:hypothetical protein
VDRAWELQGELEKHLPPTETEFSRLKGNILVGSVLAKAGLSDSARAVWGRNRGDSLVDPSGDLALIEAVHRNAIGDTEGALDLLRRYLALNPEARKDRDWANHWWWEDLRKNPEFRDMVGLLLEPDSSAGG